MKILKTSARLYVDDLDRALPLLTELTGCDPRQRFSYGELELAAIGDFLVVAGSPEALAPFRSVQATVVVDDLVEAERVLSTHGAEILSGPKDVPTGRNLTARHADGAVIEYVELREASGLAV
ncbi:VOC family protein [Streptomyces sp. NBC_00005]|uniref:VOC family protein n=1 Tax=Streptomyces sp. NBC_00005 TaxID=2903609 RepID=UPI00324F5120